MKSETVIIRIEKELKEKLAEVAKNSRRNVSDYLRLIIESAVQKKTKV